MRDEVGGKRIGKDPEKKKARLERRAQEEPKGETDGAKGEGLKDPALEERPSGDIDDLATDVANVELEATPASTAPSEDLDSRASKNSRGEEEDDEADWSHVPIKSRRAEDEDAASDTDSFASDSDPSWITPDNVHLHKARDTGVFTASSGSANSSVAQNLESSMTTASESASVAAKTDKTSAEDGEGKGPTMKAALLTGDYAMQNSTLR